MCRWLAYSGPSMAMEDLLFKPENSLIRQSLAATKSIVPTNGDGFGLGWYGARAHPGIFRDTLPAWNDANLRSLSEQIESKLFFAHVRASTGTSTSRENCHPFRWRQHMFMHNGRIGGYDRIRRALEQDISSELFGQRYGTTDSEAFFLLACGNGLDSDVEYALKQTVTRVLDLMAKCGTDEPFRMTMAVSDGEKLHALRFSSDNQSPTLFYAAGGCVRVDGASVVFDDRGKCDAILVLSEPLDERVEGWAAIPEAHLLTAQDGQVSVRPFNL